MALERLARMLAESGRVDIIGQTTEPEEAIATLSDLCVADAYRTTIGIDVSVPAYDLPGSNAQPPPC